MRPIKTTKSKSRPELGPKDYEALGRALEAVVVADYIDSLHNTPRQIWSSFVRGAAGGLGGIIGATLGLAILLFFLKFLGSHLPLVGQYFRHLGQTIQTKTQVR